jgi:hypothetical protein
MSKKLSSEEKQKRAEQRKAQKEIAKELKRIEIETSQLKVESITISIEWKKSRMWRYNPHAMAVVRFHDGQSATFVEQDGFTCSGCGYDKESTVIADIFNSFLKYKLHNENLDREAKPYGIRFHEHTIHSQIFIHAGYDGGIGTSCYTKISEYIGGKFEHIASGKTFDVYEYTDLQNSEKKFCDELAKEE